VRTTRGLLGGIAGQERFALIKGACPLLDGPTDEREMAKRIREEKAAG
jgi:hypothetical protein